VTEPESGEPRRRQRRSGSSKADSNKATKQQSSKTTKQQNNKTAKQQSSKTTKQQNIQPLEYTKQSLI